MDFKGGGKGRHRFPIRTQNVKETTKNAATAALLVLNAGCPAGDSRNLGSSKKSRVTILESLKSRGFLENPGGKQPSALSLAPAGWKTQPLHTNTYKALETKTGEKIFTQNNC